MTDGTEQILVSEYLPILVRRGKLDEAVKAMVQYVYNHQELLLLNGESKPRDLSGLKENGYKSLISQLILADEIATIYESSYGYFKANSRSKIQKNPIVDQIEHLQSITPATLHYMVSHPEYLKPTLTKSAIRIRNQNYQPQKTLSLQNVNSYDIYENRVVLGFLRRMVDEILELRTQCEKLLQRIPANGRHKNT